MNQETQFGARVRSLRKQKQISLRKFAERVGISPTYLSRVERDEFPPPAENTVVAIAKALGVDPDELLALANRIASDLSEIIKRHPREMATFLRSSKGLTAQDLKHLTDEAQRIKESD